MAYDDKCAKCLNLEWDNKERYTSTDRYWCKEKRKYVEPTDSSCYYFLEDKSKSTNGGYQQSGCYITTIVVNILGYADDCELLTTLRNFRDNTLKLNPDYLPILFEYDRIGPIISEYLRQQNNQKFCLELVQNFLIPCTKLIQEEKVEEAVETYKNMVLFLKETFEIPELVTETTVNIDLETLGKGRIRQPKTSEI